MNSNEKGFIHLLAVALIVTTVGGAGTVAASNSARPGDALYGIDRAVENVRGGLMIGENNKATYQAKLVEERLSELNSLVDNNAPVERIELAQSKYQENLEKALVKAEEAKQNGKDVNEVMELLATNSLRQTAVLQGVYEKVPEQAKESILRAQEASKKGFETSAAALGKEKADAIKDGLRSEYPNIDELTNNKARESAQEEAQDRAPEASDDNQNRTNATDSPQRQ